jgi:hypothetical protein
MLLGLALILVYSCAKDDIAAPADLEIDERNPKLTGPASNIALVGLGADSLLHLIRSGPPATTSEKIAVTQLRPGEVLLAIETDPVNRILYAVSDQSLLYRIDLATGAATAVSQQSFTPAIEGRTVAFDFNTVDNTLRLMTEGGQNLRISPTTGQVVGQDAPINTDLYALNGAAYLPPVRGRSNMYVLDTKSGNLMIMANPGNGIAQVVGHTGLILAGEGGFEIAPDFGAYAVQLCSGGPTDDTAHEAYRLLSIELRRGTARNLGELPRMVGLAIMP